MRISNFEFPVATWTRGLKRGSAILSTSQYCTSLVSSLSRDSRLPCVVCLCPWLVLVVLSTTCPFIIIHNLILPYLVSTPKSSSAILENSLMLSPPIQFQSSYILKFQCASAILRFRHNNRQMRSVHGGWKMKQIQYVCDNSPNNRL